MLDLLRGAPDIAGLQQALEERDAEIATLQDRLQAYQDADQRDFLADNSDQLATIISTKNQVIQELQAQLQALDSGGGALASALEAARTSAAEVERLRKHVEAAELELRSSDRRLREHQHQLQLYREENNRQAGELASSAAKSAVDIGRLQAALKVATEKSARLESKAALQQLGATPATEPSKEHERMMLQKEEEFELCCAERVKALEAREAATVESQAAVKQHDALEQEVQEQMRVLEERKRMMLQKEDEFELCCAERVKALEAREAAMVESQAAVKQHDALEQEVQEHACVEERKRMMLQKEDEFELCCAERVKALEAREAAMVESQAAVKQHDALEQEVQEQMRVLEGRKRMMFRRKRSLSFAAQSV
ncbi:unnamed protein product [Effrenium voratum]|uniref:Uncharacterized protein n=1 Tax=Effrenium voratum TaxID=2562239 RepID=A0AA36IEE3_9DINO|nr:unnamed protein product [Effrenium voratum]